MIWSMRKWLEKLKFVVVFVLLTYLLYHVLLVVSGWIPPMEKYGQPKGKSVKVFQQHASIGDQGSLADRLRLFYWYGE
jgi:hypothetical protein